MLWAGAVGRGAAAGDGACEGRAEGRRWPAGNQIEADGAASLAPGLLRMAQLTSLDLGGTLRDIGGSWRCERVLANAGCAPMMLRAVGWGGWARGCSGWWGLRAASRGAAVACRQSDWSRWGSVACTESRKDGASVVAGPQLYAACHRRQLALFAGACERRQCADDDACCGLRRLGAGL